MTETHTTFCRICESLCGLEVTTEENRVVAIKPDANHVATFGFACPKGMKQHVMYDSPDRVRYPLRRRGTTFERVGWDEAISDIGARAGSDPFDPVAAVWSAIMRCAAEPFAWRRARAAS